MYGIIMAAGRGTRMRPTTQAVNKHLLLVYDRPMIYFPLAALMSMGISRIVIVINPGDRPAFEKILSYEDCKRRLGVTLEYVVQRNPGIVEGINLARSACSTWKSEPCVLMLGDNLFTGINWPLMLRDMAEGSPAAGVIGLRRSDHRHYGVALLDPTTGQPAQFVEKPSDPKAGLIVPGVYWFSPEAAAKAGAIEPSARGELEITDLLDRLLLLGDKVNLERLPPRAIWLDMGTADDLLLASQLIATTVRAGSRDQPGVPELAAVLAGLISDRAVAVPSQMLSPYDFLVKDLLS